MSCRPLLTEQPQDLGQLEALGQLVSGPPQMLEDCLGPRRINRVCPRCVCVVGLFSVGRDAVHS